MTLVMIWKERGGKRVWVASDSRLTNPTENGHSRLTDRAGKILEAPVAVHDPRGTDAPTWSTTVGLAYSGSTLVALETYTAVLPLWCRLQGYGPISLKDLAAHLAKFLEGYALELGAVSQAASCDCALLGVDPVSGAFVGWRIQALISPAGVAIKQRELQLTERRIEFLGDGRKEAEARLAALKRKGKTWSREPLEMIRTFLGEDPPNTVGGGVQIGMLYDKGFQLYADGQIITANKDGGIDLPNGVMRFRGFDYAQIGSVGDAVAGLSAISRGWV